MIPFDFEYYRPNTIEEAVALYSDLDKKGKQPCYFSGGTEIITLGRLNLLYTEAVIDVKNIRECQLFYKEKNNLYLGDAIPLAEVEESNLFPLLAKTSSEIADHTARNKITLGGNICGDLFYREAVLPFLLADSLIVLAGQDGIRQENINHVFNKTLQLKKGEFLVQIVTEERYLKAPHISVKKRKQWDVGYPLITVAALKIAGQVRVAISGLCPFPFRAFQLESLLNNTNLPLEERVITAINHSLPSPILNDVEGSAAYRKFVLKNTLVDIFSELEGV